MIKHIKGKVVYEMIGPGCWGIIDERGNQWRPVNMPAQLKEPGKMVEVRVKEIQEDFSIFMWGQPVRIVGQ